MVNGGAELTDEDIYQLAPFARLLGVEFLDLRPDLVKARLAARTELSTLGGSMHGGALMGLCDLGIAVCVGLNLKPGHTMTTAESTSYFLRAMRGSAAVVSAVPLKIGRSMAYATADIFDDQGSHCARTCQAVAILPPQA